LSAHEPRKKCCLQLTLESSKNNLIEFFFTFFGKISATANARDFKFCFLKWLQWNLQNLPQTSDSNTTIYLLTLDDSFLVFVYNLEHKAHKIQSFSEQQKNLLSLACRLKHHVFDVTECVADIAFVIDNSGSIRDNDPPGGNNWQLILDFVKSIVEKFTISPDVTRVAVVDFG